LRPNDANYINIALDNVLLSEMFLAII